MLKTESTIALKATPPLSSFYRFVIQKIENMVLKVVGTEHVAVSQLLEGKHALNHGMFIRLSIMMNMYFLRDFTGKREEDFLRYFDLYELSMIKKKLLQYGIYIKE